MSTGLFTELHPPLSARDAVIEADRCLECGGAPGAPCVNGCPAGVDVPAFVAAIADGEPGAAARIIFDANLLGGTCARTCPTEELCAQDCVLLHDGREAIDIGALQRFATDWAYRNDVALRERAPASGKHVVVIGAGPAGLAAAGELGALGHDVTVYDERQQPGGLVRYAIAPYRQLNEPLPEEIRLLGLLGVKFRFGCHIDEELLAELDQEADAIVLAVGMGGDADVLYPGDDLAGVWDSLPFIEQLKTAERPEIGRRVVVIGGGNTAIDCAIEARRLGAPDVTMVYRRTRDEMPAYAHEVELAEREGVAFTWLSAPLRFIGARQLTGVECIRMRLGEPDADGRRRPEEIPGSEFTILADTAIKAIGQRPRPEFLDLVRSADELGRTASPKIFAAGDAVTGGATVVQAVRGAKQVALGIQELLS